MLEVVDTKNREAFHKRISLARRHGWLLYRRARCLVAVPPQERHTCSMAERIWDLWRTFSPLLWRSHEILLRKASFPKAPQASRSMWVLVAPASSAEKETLFFNKFISGCLALAFVWLVGNVTENAFFCSGVPSYLSDSSNQLIAATSSALCGSGILIINFDVLLSVCKCFVVPVLISDEME